MIQTTAPNIRTAEDAERVAAEIVQQQQQLATLAAEKKAALDLIKQKYEAEGLPVLKQLERNQQALSDYTCRNKGNGKFLTHGKRRVFGNLFIAHRDNAETVQFLEGHTDKSVTEQLVQTHDIYAAIERLLKRQKVQHFLRLKPELNLTGLREACKTGKVKEAELTPLGLTYASKETVTVGEVE